MRNFWTKDECIKEALKYNTKSDFRKFSQSAYSSSIRNKWIDDVCSHMPIVKRENGYWTKERCALETLKYKTKKEFKSNSNKCYQTVKKNKWYDLFSHMEITGDMYSRVIYVYEFSDNCVYVGLTYDVNFRNKEHMRKKNSQVNKHIKVSGLIPNLKIITDYLYVTEAQIMENKILEEYKDNNWYILNVAKTGSVGGFSILNYTKQSCKEKYLLCKNRTEFKMKYRSFYRTSLKNKWINDF